jgi:hypothetical protein
VKPPVAEAGGRVTERRPSGNVTASLRDQARQLVTEAERCHPDLVTWAAGFVAGWDARDRAGAQ